MVNFKASSHAGAHKRALAGGADEDVRKCDKLVAPRAVEGAAVTAAAGLALTVHSVERSAARPVKSCLVSPLVYSRLAAAGAGSGGVYVRRPGSDCVLTARPAEHVADRAIELTDVQCRNLRVCPRENYAWEPFACGAEAGALGAVFFEVWLLDPADADELGRALVFDETQLAAQLRRELFGHVVSDSELIAFSARPTAGARDVGLALRVTGVLANAADAVAVEPRELADPDDDEADDGDGARGRGVVGAHVWRGRVGADTQVLVAKLEPTASDGALDGHRQPSTRFELVGGAAALERIGALRAAPRAGEVHILCSDGEWFPVSARLLKPCIALNRPVRDALGARAAHGDDAPPEVRVDVDTLSLDKVLLHLEARLRGADGALDIGTAEQLRPISARLGYRALLEHCDRVLGDFAARLRVYRWAEVCAHNESGGCWIVMDGMVLDVERWLPEHPGGETIIPQQARGVDSTVWFELYHASRESFEYIKEFYVGEIVAPDLPAVPMATAAANGLGTAAGRASDDFMAQLREFCDPFRIGNSLAAQLDAQPVQAFKSF
jgi:hypothetical protein